MSFIFVHWKSKFFLPTFKEFGVNSTYEYVSTTRLKSKTFALQCLSQKSSNCLQNLLFESLFSLSFRRHFWLSQIFDQRLLFDYKQLCIWPLEVSKHDEPGNHSKNQRLKPLGKGEFYLIISVSFTLVISFVHLFVLVLSIIVWLLSGGLNTCPKCGCVLLISLCIFLAGSE